jgi:hypothetical protein
MVFALALGVNSLGSKIALVAIPWAVLAITGSAVAGGAVVVCETIPFAAGGLLGGPALARVPALRLVVGADMLRLLTDAAFGTLVIISCRRVLPFCLAGLVLGLGNVIGSVGREVLVAESASALEERVQWNAVIQTARSAAGILGPIVAGVLLAVVGAAICFLVDAVTYVFAAGIVWALFRGQATRRVVAGAVGASQYVREIVAACRVILRGRSLRLLVSQGALTNMIITPLAGGILLVLVAQREWHSASSLGAVVAASSVGTVGGGIVLSRSPMLGARRRYGVLVLAMCLPFVLFVARFQIAVGFAMLLFGVLGAWVNVLADSILQAEIPEAHRSAVFGCIVSGLAVLEPVGVLVASIIVAQVGVGLTVDAFVGAAAAVGLWSAVVVKNV